MPPSPPPPSLLLSWPQGSPALQAAHGWRLLPAAAALAVARGQPEAALRALAALGAAQPPLAPQTTALRGGCC
jgi:hypothetical protein